MAQPFQCPKCGSKNYVVVMTGCSVKGATIEEAYTWDEEAQDYSFGGSQVVESETVENEAAHAVCGQCEEDVTEAVDAYEKTQAEAGDGEVQA